MWMLFFFYLCFLCTTIVRINVISCTTVILRYFTLFVCEASTVPLMQTLLKLGGVAIVFHVLLCPSKSSTGVLIIHIIPKLKLTRSEYKTPHPRNIAYANNYLWEQHPDITCKTCDICVHTHSKYLNAFFFYSEKKTRNTEET